jgi:hypothetical protein
MAHPFQYLVKGYLRANRFPPQGEYFFKKLVASQNATFLCPPVKFLFPAFSISFSDKFPEFFPGGTSPTAELSQFPICR